MVIGTFLKLAWRNIWRNKRRTIITGASILFAVFFAIILKGIIIGFYGHAIDNIVNSYSGYIQLHSKEYWEDKTIDNSFESTTELNVAVRSVSNVAQFIPRLESPALVAATVQSKGALIIGTDIDKEVQFTKLNKKLAKGRMLESGKNEVMIAEGLAKFLQVKVRDTLVMLSTGYHGVSAEGKYVICGILSFPVPDMNNHAVFMNLLNCQEFFSAPDRLTSLLIDIHDKQQLYVTADELRTRTGAENYEVMPWQEILPELDSLMETEQNNTMIFIIILYMVVGFGVLGTVLMMTAERKKEFGVLVAMGMKKGQLIIILSIEMLLIGLVGIIAGILVSLPVVYYGYKNPIQLTGTKAKQLIQYGFEPLMPFAWQADYIINQAVVILFFIFIASLYPILKISKSKPVEALRG